MRLTVGPPGSLQPSNTLPFTYSAPIIGSLNPQNGPTAGNFTLTINGQNFVRVLPAIVGRRTVLQGTGGGFVTLGGASCPILTLTHTKITCAVQPGEGARRAVCSTSTPSLVRRCQQASDRDRRQSDVECRHLQLWCALHYVSLPCTPLHPSVDAPVINPPVSPTADFTAGGSVMTVSGKNFVSIVRLKASWLSTAS